MPLFFSFLRLFYSLCYHPTTCTASVELLFSGLPSISCPSSLLLLCSHAPALCVDILWLWWSMSIHSVYMHGCVFMMMLLSANEARACLVAPRGLLCSMMRLVSADEAFVLTSPQTFAHYLRRDKCTALDRGTEKRWKWQRDNNTMKLFFTVYI